MICYINILHISLLTICVTYSENFAQKTPCAIHKKIHSMQEINMLIRLLPVSNFICLNVFCFDNKQPKKIFLCHTIFSQKFIDLHLKVLYFSCIFCTI